MADIKHRLILVGWLVLFNVGPSVHPAMASPSFEGSLTDQQKITAFFKTAPSVWQGGQQENLSRQRLPLNGRWRVSCKEPAFSGEVELPAAFSFEGEVVFQRSFQLDSVFVNRPLRLVIQGAHYETKVEINGDFVGSHEGGYTPFEVDLPPDRVFVGKENLLTVTVSNKLSPLQTLPAKQRPWGWLNEGGVLREIYLETLPDIFIENTQPKYTIDQLAVRLNLKTEVRFQKKMAAEETAGVSALLEIWGEQVITSQGGKGFTETRAFGKLAASTPTPLVSHDKLRQTLSLSCQLNQPTLWSPTTPYLYTMRLVLLRQNTVIDERWQTLGFRKIEIVDHRLLLNGEPFFVRGVNWIENYGNGSILLDTTQALKMLAEVKELGANVIRVVGHPPHPFLPALCDRLGIFLLEELPVYYLTEAHFRQPQFSKLVSLQAREMIFRDLNHPSVLGWGLSVNSALFAPDTKTTASHLCQELRQLDDRPIYAVTPLAWSSAWEPLVDFLLPDLFEQEKANAYSGAAANSSKAFFPIIGFWARDEIVASEAAPQKTGNEAEQQQAKKLGELLEKFEEMPQFAGYFLQTLTDWPAAMPVLTLGPNLENLASALVAASPGTIRSSGARTDFNHPAGVIDRDGRRRMAFQVVQAFNRGDRRPVLMAKHLAPAHPQEYPIVGIGVILLFLFYLNRDRRLRGNLQRIFVHPHGFYVDVYEHRKVPPFLTTLLGLMEGCIVALLLSAFCYANRESMIFDQFLNLLIATPLWKARVIWLIWHPGWFIAIVTAGLFALGVAAAVWLRILGFFLGRGLPIIQYYTFVFWTSANLLLLGILTPFFYRLLLYSDFAAPLMFVISIVFLWLAGRYFRGMRVIYTMSIPRTTIIYGILAGGLIVSLVLYYQRTEAIFEYVNYYWQMLNIGG